jgi:signal peptidase II
MALQDEKQEIERLHPEKETPAQESTAHDALQPDRNLWRDYAYLVLLAGAILLLDQWTKHIVRSNLASGETWMPLEWLAPYARIINWHNTGAAFGMFQGGSTIFTILGVIVVGVIFYYFPKVPREDWPLRLAMGMQLGGALGNLTDRFNLGYVTDFISVGRFPVFNVADSSISLGVAVLLIGMWWIEKNEKRENGEFEQETSRAAPADEAA